jgi:hypothetical protein
MTALTKIACALLMTSGLAGAALAAPGDAGSGPTMGATPQNDAGSGPTKGANSNPTNSTTSGQNSTTNGQTSMNGQNDMNDQNGMNAGSGMQISKTLKKDLDKAGFTDVKIMPESFLVQAKDSQGNPVVMMINPNSITALTEETGKTNSASNANHGAANNGGNSNSAGGTPGPNSTGGSQPVTPGGATKP